MVKIIALFTLLFAFNSFVWSQLPTGQWRMHVANKAIDIASGNGQVFAALETGLIEYDINANEASLWTDVNSLSDIQITCVYYHPESKSFFVGYKNGNIDHIVNNTVINIPALKMASIQGEKKVYSFSGNGNHVYASTGIGVLVIDASNNEIKDTYYPTITQEPILQVAFLNDSIYALTRYNLVKANLQNKALADPTQWKRNSHVRTIVGDTAQYSKIFSFKGNLLISKNTKNFGLDTLFKLNSSGFSDALNLTFVAEIKNFNVFQDNILLVLYDGVLKYDENLVYMDVYNQYKGYDNIENFNATLVDKDIYVADLNNGLFEFSGGILTHIKVNGPRRNSFFALSGTADKIAVAGGEIHKTGFGFNPSGAYVFDDESWTNFYKDGQNLWKPRLIFDVSTVSINPQNTDHIAIGSYSEVPLSITTDAKTITSYFDEENSLLEKPSPQNPYVCISDIEYDKKGNLWVVNCYSSFPLKVYTKDGVWHKFSQGNTVQNKYSGKLIIDNNGNKWFSVYDQGLIGYSDNNTIEDPSDDRYVIVNNGENTGALPESNVTAIAVDLDNRIWIGTSNGFAVLYNPENAFDAQQGEYNTQRIKIEYEGNVEYVLGNTSITDIEVDGGNRKWIGTANAGIFMLSPDGSEVLESFTKENSAIISNNILDMEFNDKTGELFVITDIGLVSLRTNSSKGDPNYEDVSVFPNPVKPEFEGLITIQGIKYDSDVKFTDVAGNLVYQTTSNGGTATWNGKHFNGEKVKAGTYLIWTASNTEKGRKVGRVVIQN